MALRVLSFATPDGLATFANAAQEVLSAAIVVGGNGYNVDDLLYVVGGIFEAPVCLKVVTEVANVITGVSIENEGAYSTVPANPVSVTGGSGAGATFNLTWGPAIQQADVYGIQTRSGRWYLSYEV